MTIAIDLPDWVKERVDDLFIGCETKPTVGSHQWFNLVVDAIAAEVSDLCEYLRQEYCDAYADEDAAIAANDPDNHEDCDQRFLTWMEEAGLNV